MMFRIRVNSHSFAVKKSTSLAFLMLAVRVLGYEPGDMVTAVRMAQLKGAIESFHIDLYRYPTASEGLAALSYCPTSVSTNMWLGPYLDDPVMGVQDAWGHRFVYVVPGIHNTNAFDLYSLGEDGVSKSAGNDPDDINNWNEARPWQDFYVRAQYMERLRPLIWGFVLAAIGIAVAWWLNWGSRGKREV